MVTVKFSLYFIGLWKRDVSLLLRQHNNSIYCGNGSETFRFLFSAHFLYGSEMFRFFYQHNNSIYCGNGSETFRFLLPIVCMEARCFASFNNTTIVYIVGMEAKHFASCCPFSLCGSEMFRFFYQTQQ